MFLWRGTSNQRISSTEFTTTAKEVPRIDQFLQAFARILQPLNILAATTKKEEWTWNEQAAAAFQAAKTALAEATLLCHPVPDAPTSIMTDASDIAVGAVLQQFHQGNWRPIAYFSKQLKPNEKKYSTFDRELLAVYLSIKHFRHFVEGRAFHVKTDHKPLTSALRTSTSKHTSTAVILDNASATGLSVPFTWRRSVVN